MAIVTRPLCEFEKGCGVSVVFDDETGELLGLDAVNPTADRVLIATVEKGHAAQRVKLGEPGEARSEALTAAVVDAAGGKPAERVDPDAKEAPVLSWPGLVVNVQSLDYKHPDASA